MQPLFQKKRKEDAKKEKRIAGSRTKNDRNSDLFPFFFIDFPKEKRYNKEKGPEIRGLPTDPAVISESY